MSSLKIARVCCAAAAVLFGLALPACASRRSRVEIVGGGGPQSKEIRGRVVRLEGVTLEFTEPVKRLPFNVREVRMRAAIKQLNTIAGHAISFRFDAAIVPQHIDSFQGRFTEAVETTAQDLADFKKRHALAFSRTVGEIQRIECYYDVTARHGDSLRNAQFDARKKVLRIPVGSDSWQFVPAGVVFHNLANRFAQQQEQRFDSIQPQRVPVSAHAEYFEYRRHRPRGKKRIKFANKLEQLTRDPRARAIESIITLHGLSRDRDLRAQMQNWLVDSSQHHFPGPHMREPAIVAKLAPDSAFLSAERAYSQWLNRNLRNLSAKQKAMVMKTVVMRRFNRDSDRGRYVREALPGFDGFAFGAAIITDWVRTRHGATVAEDKDKDLLSLFGDVVCHSKRRNNGRWDTPRCNRYWYGYVWRNRRDRARLVGLILKHNDADLAASAIAAIHREVGAKDAIELWRKLERNEKLWMAATTILAENIARGSADYRAEAQRWLPGKPRARVLLQKMIGG